MLKRLFDITLSFIGLLVLFPLFVVIAVLIKLNSKGPVFYRGVRVGLRGRLFRMYKFRTMVVDAEKLGGPSTPADDPRITRIGRFLRRRGKLDELPQLINVLEGDMSLVGPRPEVPQYVALYTDEEKAVLRVRPGLTDYASVWNSNEGEILRGSQDPEKDYMEKIKPEKIRLQLKYVKNHSFWVDLTIILQTLKVVIWK
jgi:lipopolysaccharide/colanic/teichoic acid biosynthesis glycosyltransferase